MSFAKRLLLLALVPALAAIIVILLAPLLVAEGLRLFVWWKGREQGVKIEFQKVEAPFLKPVVIHGLRVISTRPCLFRVEIAAQQAMFDLNLRSVFSRSNVRILHGASVEGLRCDIRRDPRETTECNFDWRFLHRLLADQVKLTNVDLHISNGSTDFDLRGAEWTASEVESGKFSAREASISAPFFHQRFSDLRGATKWENDRLTLGALSLARGLDIETITADFSGLEKKRLGIELNLDAFGGQVRANIASENRDKGIFWNVAGSASAISLAQMSPAIGLREPIAGSLRASKFTFHGDVQNLAHATSSVWMEVSGFSWRDSGAETVMFGASLYSRQIQVEQIYVKQRHNQLTLSGEYALPAKSSDWINPNFRADISASISELGEFAKLFGGTTKDFSGALTISGTVNGRARNLAGQITLEGNALRLWAAPVDTFNAKFSLKGAKLTLDLLQARHLDDFFNATGEVSLTRDHPYSVKVNGAIANLGDYSSLLPTRWRALQPEGRASLGWDGQGTANTHSGDFRLQAENVRLTTDFGLRPFDAKFEGTYSPQNIFFRDFRLSNPQAQLNAFVSVASNYLQLQTMHFDLNGKSVLQGNIFIPVALHRWWRTRSLDSFNKKQNFDVDLMLDELDLAELQNALTDRASMAGKLGGRLETYGSLQSLQSKLEADLRDFAFADPHRLSAELRAEIMSESLSLRLLTTFANSKPARLEAKLPLRFSRADANDPRLFAWEGPVSAALNLPAILLSKVPRYLSRKVFRDGIGSGNVAVSGTLKSPSLSGDLALLNGRFVKAPEPLDAISGRIQFNGSSATIAFANIDVGETKLPFNGAIDFADMSNVSIKLIPELPAFDLSAIAAGNCISGVNIFGLRRGDSETNPFAQVQKIELHAGIASHPWTVTLFEFGAAQALNSKSSFARTFPLCKTGGSVLQLAVPPMQKTDFGQRALNIFRGENPPTFPPNQRQLH